jgi:hypothetical protein
MTDRAFPDFGEISPILQKYALARLSQYPVGRLGMAYSVFNDGDRKWSRIDSWSSAHFVSGFGFPTVLN